MSVLPEVCESIEVPRRMISPLAFNTIEALPQTIAFVGIRRLEFDTDDEGDYEADDDNVHFGVRLTF